MHDAVVALLTLVDSSVVADRPDRADRGAPVVSVAIPIVALLAVVQLAVPARSARFVLRNTEAARHPLVVVGDRQALEVWRAAVILVRGTEDGADEELEVGHAGRFEVEAVVVGLASPAEQRQVGRAVVGAVVVVDIVAVVALLALVELSIAARVGDVGVGRGIGVALDGGVAVGPNVARVRDRNVQVEGAAVVDIAGRRAAVVDIAGRGAAVGLYRVVAAPGSEYRRRDDRAKHEKMEAAA